MARRIISAPTRSTPSSPAAAAPDETLKDLACFNHAALSWECGSVLVTGGQRGDRLEQSYYIYNPEADAWTKKRAPFRGRIWPGLASLGTRRALLIGGTSRAESFLYENEGRAGSGLEDAWIFNQGEWRSVASCANRHASPELVPFEGDALVVDSSPERWLSSEEDFVALPVGPIGPTHASAVFRGQLVVHSFDETGVWDPKSNVWSRLPAAPGSRLGAPLVEFGDGLLLVGGRERGKGFTDRIDAFDGHRWRELGRLRSPRAFHQAVKVGARMVVVGGMNDGRDPLPIELLEPGSTQTIVLESMTLPPMTAFQAVASRNRVCVIGGLIQSAGSAGDPESPRGVTWIDLP